MTIATTLFIYLFPSDVWGTVSDWCMVGITSLTAFYLYKTLQSQKDVQQTQNELFKIESIRFKESIKPVLQFMGTTEIFKPGEDDKKILTIQVSNQTESTALNISRILSEGKQSNQVFIPTGYSDIRDHVTKGDKPLLFHFLIDTKNAASKFISFTINYQDIAGTNYKQGVFCICDNFGLELHPYLPEIVS
jgi:hypothetical protein